MDVGTGLAAILVAAFGVLILSLSAWGVIWPQKLMDLVRGMADQPFMLMAVGSRVILAIILWFGAPLARHPLVFQIIAVVALLAAFTMLIAGKERLLRMVGWWTERSAAIQRGWLLLGLVFGGYLLWAIWPAISTG